MISRIHEIQHTPRKLGVVGWVLPRVKCHVSKRRQKTLAENLVSAQVARRANLSFLRIPPLFVAWPAQLSCIHVGFLHVGSMIVLPLASLFQMNHSLQYSF